MADTRKDKRAAQAIKMRFKSATLDEFVEKYSGDISRGGCFIKTKTPMKVGTLLKFEFQLKDASRLIHGVGRVTWRREETAGPDAPAGMGIKFIKMDPDSRSLIQRIVESRGDGPGRYDQGAEPAAPDAGGFFPDGPPAEQPAHEDRTSVRHASEFLASALGAASDEGGQAAAEAEKAAEEARKRTAEIEARREAERAQLAGNVPATAPPTEGNDEDEQAAAPPASGLTPIDDGEDFDEDAATTVASRAMLDGILDGPSSEDREDATMRTNPGASALDGDGFSKRARAREDEDTLQHTSGGPAAGAAAKAPSASGANKAKQDEGGGNAGMWVGLLLLLAIGGGAGWYFTMGPGAAAPTPAAEPPTVTPEPETPEPTPDPETPADAVVDGTESLDAGTPEPAEMVSVRIESTPRGTVTVGGEEQGTTPLSIELPAGQATAVSVQAEGHLVMARDITPEAGSTGTTERFALERMPYVLKVETNVPGAVIVASRQTADEAGEISWTSPPPTRFQVAATADGYIRGTAQVVRSAFEERDGAFRQTVQIELQPRTRGSSMSTMATMAPMSGMRPEQPDYSNVELPEPTMIETMEPAPSMEPAPAPTMEPAPSMEAAMEAAPAPTMEAAMAPTMEAAMAPSMEAPAAPSAGSGMLVGFD